ncbi:MAG: heparan-alpha-glucosaminide N-acetyltransferase domain-containing protein [Chitinophagaceae bacterium]
MKSSLQYRTDRIVSVDILRGIVMIIMALDHVRDFTHITAITGSPTDLATTTVPLFFTRWITHFCAPVFVFLSGLSAYLHGQGKTTKELSSFLIKRGIWLIFAEIVIMSLILTFNPLYEVILLGVIWVIGWAMIFLGILIRGGYKLVAVIGIVLVFGHDLVNYLVLPQPGTVTRTLLDIFLTTSGSVVPYAEGRLVIIAYAILPWTGVICLGYAFGKFFGKQTSVEKRRKTLLVAGLLITALFILLRLVNQYGEPQPWTVQPNSIYTFLSFLNLSKYPPSLQFLCMTIGPALLVLYLTDQWRGKIPAVLSVYGRVPFFYFVLHFFLIHLITVVLFFATGHGVGEIVDASSPFLFRPANYGFSLGVVYLVWILVVFLMYFPCKWYMRYKATHDKWWLSYV